MFLVLGINSSVLNKSSDPAMEETTSTGTLTPSSSSVDSLPILPYEIVEDILSRLPAKSLMRFQCVCKSFKSLITDPSFAKKHLHAPATRHQRFLLNFSSHSPRARARMGSVIRSYRLSSSVFTPTQLECPLGYCIQVLGNCNGIFCMEIHDPGVRGCRIIILWNPSIRKYTRLPYLKNKGILNFGFGYDRSTYTYKVVVISSTDEGGDYGLTRVHIMGTNVWRRIQDSPRFPYESGKFVSGSGTLNWLTTQSIISFDLEKESYRELLYPGFDPTALLRPPRIMDLCVLRDCLCVVHCHSTFSDVWFMKEYGNNDSWTKFIHIQAKDISRVLYLYEDDQVLLVLKSSRKLGVYDSRDGTVKKTLVIKNNCGYRALEVYQETLISPVL